MHKSKLAGFIIDCNTKDLPAAAGFWGAALGLPTRNFPGEEGRKYTGLDDPITRLDIEVQIVDHPSRVHLDIETDNIEAEVARLEALGARRMEKIKNWVVMEAPTGHRFCVVRADPGPDFDKRATRWP